MYVVQESYLDNIINVIALYCRFDVDKECDKIDGNLTKNDSPAIVNSRHKTIKSKMDATGEIYICFPLDCIISVPRDLLFTFNGF